MAFDQARADDDDEPRRLGAVSPLVWMTVAATAALAIGFAGFFSFETDHRATLERAALKLGVTAELRARLRHDLQTALIEMERELCDEDLRDRAGKRAVAYYETLLEKPVLAAALEVTYDSRCQPRIDSRTHPFDVMIARGGLGGGLVMPWACLPDEWRSPLDRAIQSKIEQHLRSGYLTSESLSGTLALVARSYDTGGLKSRCRKSSSSSRRDLPLTYEALDDWDRRRRRRY